MKKSRKILFAASAAMMITLAGCGGEDAPKEEVIPTAAPTAAPTLPPATATPAPTSTPAPRMIGEKNSQSKFVYLTNALGADVRELYLMVSGAGDWGENLIPSESSIKASEQVQMFYTPESGTTDTSEDEGSSNAALYDMKLVTSEGNTYEIYSIELADMEKASLTIDPDTSAVYLRYMSLSDKKEKDTRENSQQTGSNEDESDNSGYETSDNYDESSSDDGSYNDDSGYYDGSSEENDDSDNGSYDNGSSDDGSYDDSYDDSDDGSNDDGNYDDGSSDDGDWDDGSYDDGSSDNSSGDDFVDAGTGDGYYETE